MDIDRGPERDIHTCSLPCVNLVGWFRVLPSLTMSTKGKRVIHASRNGRAESWRAVLDMYPGRGSSFWSLWRRCPLVPAKSVRLRAAHREVPDAQADGVEHYLAKTRDARTVCVRRKAPSTLAAASLLRRGTQGAPDKATETPIERAIEAHRHVSGSLRSRGRLHLHVL